MSNKKIKSVRPEPEGRIKVPQDDSPYSMIQHPVFCFKYLHKNYGIEPCSVKEKAGLLQRLVFLSTLTWSVIQTSSKHGHGSEKINQKAIIPSIPGHITKDVCFFAIRFRGKKPIVGYRTGFIFHIVYIDRNCSVYKH